MLKKISTPKLAGIIAAVIALVLLAGGVTVFFATRSPGMPKTLTATAPVSSADSARATPGEANAAQTVTAVDLDNGAAGSGNGVTSVTGSASASVQKSAAPKETPAALSTALENSGYSENDLDTCGAYQLIVVQSEGSLAEVSFFDRASGSWEQDESLTCSGYVGRNGTTADMSEGGGAAPQGLFSIGSAFYQDDAPQTGLPSFAITDDTYWIDNPDHPQYNTRVVGEDGRGNGEAMAEIPYYKYGFVINYNIPPTGYARGSAIFFHISHDSPTAGCVTVSEEMVLAYLAKLDASLAPHILII